MSTRLITVLAASAFCSFSLTAMAAPNQIDLAELTVPLMEFDSLDVDWLLQDDARRAQEGQPLRFAVPQTVLITPGNHGTWDRNIEGRLRWRMRFASEGAPHFNLGFESWTMPPSGALTVTSLDGTSSIGPFTALDNQFHEELWLPIISSDDIVVTITCDDHDRDAIVEDIALTSVNIGYRGFGAEKVNGIGRSGSCNVDVVCPEGDPWASEIPCAGLYTISGWFTCSGGMLNNTAQDLTPYFLTADHCGVSTSNDQTMVVYWNYQSSYCRTPGSGDSGGNGNGNFNQYTSGGAIVRAENGNSDFTLVELNNDPNPNFNVGFCGWDKRTVTPQIGVCIHFPNLEEKRISFEDDPLSSSGYMWRVNDWDLGTTEPGSSGSILFNQEHRIVGQLYGGNAACDNNGYDIFGKLSSSWNFGMSNWLDAAGTDEDYIDTYGGSGGNGGVCCLLGNCYNVAEATCDSSGGVWYADQFCGDVDCDSPPDPTGACCLDDGSCNSDVTNQECNASNGDWQQDTSCAAADCPQPPSTGACCITNVTCSDGYTASECSSAGGDYQGDDTDCDFVNCDTGGGDLVELHHAIVGANLVSGSQDTWTVDVFAAVGAGNRIDAVAGNSVQEKILASTDGFYQDAAGGPTSADINPAFYEFVPDMEWDSRVTIGALDQTGNPFDENNMGDVGIDWTNFENGGTLSVDNGTWYVLPTHPQGEAQAFISQDCSEQYGVLLARLTAYELDSTISMDALIQGRDVAGNNWQDTASYTLTYEATEDCNTNGVSDTCDIANGTSEDTDGNGIPDECDNSCPGDADGDGDSDVDDILLALSNYGSSGGGDVDGNGIVDVNDLLQILAYYGGC